MARLGVVMCAKCRAYCTMTVQRRKALHETVFTVRCHGEEQSVILSDQILAQTFRIEVTEAFREN